MSNDLRTEKEILHNMENRIDEINFYLWGKGEGEQEGKNINSPYGETTLRGRIGNNVESILDNKLSKLEDKLTKIDKSTSITVGEFFIYLGIIMGVFGGLLAWILIA